MSAQKTGALLGCAGALGAILARRRRAPRGGPARVRPQPGHRLSGGRRRARHLGRHQCDRQADRQRPAAAQEDAALSCTPSRSQRPPPTTCGLLAGADELVGERLHGAVALLDDAGSRAWTLELARALPDRSPGAPSKDAPWRAGRRCATCARRPCSSWAGISDAALGRSSTVAGRAAGDAGARPRLPARPSRTRPAGGRASSRPTSPWRPRTC